MLGKDFSEEKLFKPTMPVEEEEEFSRQRRWKGRKSSTDTGGDD